MLAFAVLAVTAGMARKTISATTFLPATIAAVVVLMAYIWGLHISKFRILQSRSNFRVLHDKPQKTKRENRLYNKTKAAIPDTEEPKDRRISTSIIWSPLRKLQSKRSPTKTQRGYLENEPFLARLTHDMYSAFLSPVSDYRRFYFARSYQAWPSNCASWFSALRRLAAMNGAVW